ncbi:MAG: hypothetical protein E7282_03935 [Lachnospiraceae bacterium]|nr:hypothetical protein [Lachnospiraceae bacterium]
MMFGLDNNEKELKELLAQMGCEASTFKNFKSGYEKMNKRYAQTVLTYENCYKISLHLKELTEELEHYFVDHKAMNLTEIAKEYKKMQGSFEHEFIISKQDTDFHSTYDTLIKKLPLLEKGLEDPILMQSEVENLLAILRENVDREKPNLYALSYFLADHKMIELSEMSADAKNRFIGQKFYDEVVKPIQSVINRSVRENASLGELYHKTIQVLSEMIGEWKWLE